MDNPTTTDPNQPVVPPVGDAGQTPAGMPSAPVEPVTPGVPAPVTETPVVETPAPVVPGATQG